MLLIYEPGLLEKIARCQEILIDFIEHAVHAELAASKVERNLPQNPHFTTRISIQQRSWHGPAAKLHVDECRPPHSRTALSLCHQERITMTVRRIATQAHAHEHAQSLLVRP